MNLENGISEENKTKIATTATAAKIWPFHKGKDTLKIFFQGVSWNANLTLISQCILTLNSN